MATIEQTPKACGAPGIPPRWTPGAKEAVGTAYEELDPEDLSGSITRYVHYSRGPGQCRPARVPKGLDL
jgi:hypothetical protein